MGSSSEAQPALALRHLSVEVRGPSGWIPVVDDLTLTVQRGATVGIVGESGSGKSLTALAVMGLLDGVSARVAGGSVLLDGEELVGRSKRDLADIRGRRIGMIFQEPRRSLHPAFTVGHQVAEVVRRHQRVSRSVARNRAVELLDRVGIPDPSRRSRSYPHQFSGGMCQRVMLAIALAAGPVVLIADEPTTALDVTVQQRMLDLIREIQDEEDLSMLLITHDLGVVAEMCDLVAVMYCGQLVEHRALHPLFECPSHPYTAGLLGSMPVISGGGRARLRAIPGAVPPVGTWSAACRFHPRCEFAEPGRCDVGTNPLVAAPGGGAVRCLRLGEIDLQRREDAAG